jgi:hypothetical protein
MIPFSCLGINCVPNQVDMTFLLQVCSSRLDTTFHGAHFIEISFAIIVQFLIHTLETPTIPVQDIFLLC